MPEGPSIIIAKEAATEFTGKKIISVSGNSKQDIQRLAGNKILEFKSWGKHFLICFTNFTVKIHFMLFGSYRVNEGKESPPRLSLKFKKGELNFYACSIQFIEEPLDEIYDWSADVMSDTWNPKKAIKKLSQHPDLLVCDTLLDQQIFSGVGNIIKNEVCYRIKVHPESHVMALPAKQLKLLVAEARNYSFDFLEWKKQYVLKKHWLTHSKKTCERCKIPLVKRYSGKTKRRTFFCEHCQVLYL